MLSQKFPTKPKKIPQPQTKPQKFSQKHKIPPPPACIFSDLRHFFCFILGAGLKKIANFFRKRYFLCYNFTCL